MVQQLEKEAIAKTEPQKETEGQTRCAIWGCENPGCISIMGYSLCAKHCREYGEGLVRQLREGQLEKA